MSSRLYSKAREKFLTGQLSWTSGVCRAILLPEAYTPNFAHEFVSEIFEGSRIAVSEEITGRTATDGLADCDAIAFGTLTDSRLAAKMVLFKDTSVETTSPLIAFLDTEDLQGAPLQLIGFDYFFVPNALSGGLFRL